MMIAAATIAWTALAGIVYVYAGYPALLWALAKFRTPKSGGAISMPVTLMISAFNEDRAIGKKLANSLALDYPKDLLQVIVVSDASTDQTDRSSPISARVA